MHVNEALAALLAAKCGHPAAAAATIMHRNVCDAMRCLTRSIQKFIMLDTGTLALLTNTGMPVDDALDALDSNH